MIAGPITDADRVLMKHAREARGRAWAPYSSFRVGAAVRTVGGRIVPGCNVENPTYGLTLCAERVAVMAALSDGEAVAAIAVAVPDGQNSIPCGLCRELLAEVAPSARVLLLAGDGTIGATTAEALLPGGASDPEGDGR